jgi:low temperature requirement protein LtrA
VPAQPRARVSTLELFFDLVFVFTITQLTAVLADHLDLTGAVRVLTMFGVTWWMYGGYAWLTNSIAPSSSLRRGLLLVGMGGFLTMALAVPGAFDDSGWLFGLGYFVVNAVHTGVFAALGGESVARALRGGLAALNLTSASLVLVGGFLPGGWRYGLWAAAFAVQIATPYLHPLGGFSISPAHFVERHGLVVIIALGESIIALGIGVEGLRLSFDMVVVAVLALTVAYYMYWIYFGGDDEKAEHALEHTVDPPRRASLALQGFGYAHYPLLLGVIAFAAGIKKIIGHPFDPAKLAYAVAIGGGVALFLLAHAWFRRILGIGTTRYLLLGGALALATVPLGLVVGALQLLGVIIVFSICYFAEVRPWGGRRLD